LIAEAQCGLACVYEAEGRPDKALLLSQEALTTYERLRHRKLVATRGLVKRLTAALQGIKNT
jgi:hypothetical protein